MSKEIISKEDLKSLELDTSKAQKVMKIESDKDVEAAASVLIHLKTEFDAAEEKRKEYVQPSQEAIKRINADFKKITAPREDYISKLKEVVVAYVAGRKKELKSKEKELRKEMGDRTLVLDNGVDKVVCATGELRFRKGYTFKITNKNILPDKFWMLNEKALEKAIEQEGADVASIPGVKVTVEDIASVAIYKSKE